MAWLRLYDEVVDDPKVQSLPGPVFKTWINLLCIANQGSPRGTLPSEKVLCWRLRLRQKTLVDQLYLLKTVGLCVEAAGTLHIHNWENRQFSSDSSRDRVRAHRQRQQAVTRNGLATPPEQNRSETDQIRSSLRAPAAPRDLAARFFEAEAVNERMAAVIDYWQVDLSDRQKGHLGALLKKKGHGAEVWRAVQEATLAVGDPVEYMEKVLQHERLPTAQRGSSRTGSSWRDVAEA